MVEPGILDAGKRLEPWRNAVVLWVRSDWPELTNRQFGLLLIICLERERHPVRALAARLDVSKPIICRVMDRLADLGLMIRETDKRDRRNVFAVPTPRAFEFLVAFDGMISTGSSST